jgi:hypothetical protein
VSAQQLAEIEARLREGYGADIWAARADVAVLVAHVKALRAALEPFAWWARESLISATDDPADDKTVNELYPVKTGDLRRAAAVLGTPQEGL